MSRIPVEAEISSNTAFVLRADDLKKINDAMAKFGDGNVTIKGECKDGLKRTFQLKQLLEYDNAPDHEILSLRVLTGRRASSDERWAWLSLGGNWPNANCFATFEGPESEVAKLRQAINRQVRGTKPWYDRLSRTSFGIVVSLAGVLICLMYLARMVNKLGVKVVADVATHPTHWPFIEVAAGVGTAACIFALGIVFDILRKRVFPSSVFAIGRRIESHTHMDRIRFALAAGIVSAVVGPVIGFAITTITKWSP